MPPASQISMRDCPVTPIGYVTRWYTYAFITADGTVIYMAVTPLHWHSYLLRLFGNNSAWLKENFPNKGAEKNNFDFCAKSAARFLMNECRKIGECIFPFILESMEDDLRELSAFFGNSHKNKELIPAKIAELARNMAAFSDELMRASNDLARHLPIDYAAEDHTQ